MKLAIPAKVKEIGKPVGHFAVGVGGLTVGNIVLSKIPDLAFLEKIPVVGVYLSKIAPGAAMMFLAYMLDKKIQNEFAKTGAFTLGIVGFINAAKRLTATAPEGSLLQKVNSYLPTGLGGVSQGHPVNSGHYPASYFVDSNKAYERIPEKTVSGLGNAYSLEGAGRNGGTAFKLEGFGNAYSLEGRR